MIRAGETPPALAAVCDSMPQAVFIADAAGSLLHTNSRWQRVWGYSNAQAVGDGWLSAIAPADMDRVLDAWRSATSEGRPFEAQFHLQCPDRSARLVRVTADVIKGLPGAGGYVGSVADLSELMTVEAALEDERNRLSDILEGTQAATWEWNVDTGEFRVNDRWVNILGWTLAEWEPTTIELGDLFTHPDDKVESDALLDRHFAGELDYYECESRMRHRDGRWVWVLDRGRLNTRTPDGAPEWMSGTHLDITALKLQEQRLRSTIQELEVAHDRIEVANDSGGIGVWEFELTSDTLLWDRQMCRLYGFAEDLGAVTAEYWEALVDPRDRDRLAHETAAAISEERPFDTEFRIRWSDGSVRHLRSAAKLIRDQAGDPVRFVGVNWDVTEARTLAADLAFRATHDELTGLTNRSEFDRVLDRTLQSVRRGNRDHVLLYIDLDQFKVVNDECGHHVGDRLLKEVAALLSTCIREGDVLARLGGDEFGALLADCDTATGQTVAQNICRTIDAYRLNHAGVSYRVGASVGLVLTDSHWKTTSELVQAADSACYCAKDAGRNRVFSWTQSDPVLRDRTGHTRWAARLGEALDIDGFELFGQRIMPLSPGAEGLWVEVLLRLPTTSGEHLAPGVFLPAAERFDLSTRIDHWVLERVLAKMASLPNLEQVAGITVNLSARSTSDPAFHRETMRLLADTDKSVVERLCLEISETASPRIVAAARPFIDAVREAGGRIALDDFGSGLSSFSYLKDMPVDLLKIDGQFIKGMVDDPIDDLSVRSFVELAKLVGVRTVAEHVSDARILERVRQLGIDFGQGFLLHRPAPLNKVLAQPVAVLPEQVGHPVMTARTTR